MKSPWIQTVYSCLIVVAWVKRNIHFEFGYLYLLLLNEWRDIHSSISSQVGFRISSNNLPTVASISYFAWLNKWEIEMEVMTLQYRLSRFTNLFKTLLIWDFLFHWFIASIVRADRLTGLVATINEHLLYLYSPNIGRYSICLYSLSWIITSWFPSACTFRIFFVHSQIFFRI
jgi:hypothetical protein